MSPLPPNRFYSTESLRCRVGFLLLMPTDRAASSYQPLNLSLAVFFLSRLFSIADRLSFEAGALVPSVSDTCILPLLRLDVGRPDHPASLGRPESRSTPAGVSLPEKVPPRRRRGRHKLLIGAIEPKLNSAGASLHLLMPAARITFPHFSVSPTMTAAR